MTRFYLLAISLLMAFSASAQIATWDFEPDPGTNNPASVATNATAQPATFGPGNGTASFPAGNPGEAYSSSNWPPGGIAADRYLQFVVEADAGFVINMSSISFDLDRSGTGPQSFEVLISDSPSFSPNRVYGGSINSALASTNFESFSFADDFSAEQVYVRIFGFQASGTGGTLRFDNVVIGGTVDALVTNMAPVISGCPTILSDGVGGGDDCTNATPDYTVFVTVTDDTDDPADLTVMQDPAPGTVFGVGSYEIKLFVTDLEGATSDTCRFTLNVVSGLTCPQVPVIEDCPLDTEILAEAPDCNGTVPDYTGFVIFNDTQDGQVAAMQLPAPGGTFELGETVEIKLFAVDTDGNTSDTCRFNLDLIDGNPFAVCVADGFEVFLDADGSASITADDIDDGSFDNCGEVTVAINNAMFNCDDIGSTMMMEMNPITNLFISEYVEGGSNNKYIEIYNGTGMDIDLMAGNYSVALYSNGSSTVTTATPLMGILMDGEVLVLANGGATIYTGATVTNSAVNFNGDDAFVLLADGVIIDVIGQIGFDPGSEWGTGVVSTANNTIRRKSSVFLGDANGADAFDPATEWDGFAQDDVSGLGAHTVDVNMMEVTGTAVTLTVTDNAGNTSECMTMVELRDTIRPTVTCVDTILYLDQAGEATLFVGDQITDAMDNCELDLRSFDFVFVYGCEDVGTSIESQLMVSDVAGNTSAPCTSTVTVLDTLGGLQCRDFTVILDDEGLATVTAADLTVAFPPFFGCPPPLLLGSLDTTISVSEFTCADIGTPVEVTVTQMETADVGNPFQASCVTVVTVIDTTAPVLDCSAFDVEVFLDAAGSASLSIAELEAMVGPIDAMDNCDDAPIVVSNNLVYTCDDINAGAAPAQPSDLFFSEYIEGSSNNKCLEIYNGTGADVDLSAYTVQAFNNGNPGPEATNMEELTMSGILADGDVYVICNGGAVSDFIAESDITSTVTFFNGDDAIVLLNNGVIIDIFGAIGTDPGSRWSVNGNETREQTLVRNPNILTGNLDNDPAFPALGTEWTSFPQNTSSELGSHTIDLSTAEVAGEEVTLTATDENGNSGNCTFLVTVVDTFPASVTAIADTILHLDQNGAATLVVGDVVLDTMNNCAGLNNVVLDRDAFDCADLGAAVEVLVIATDENGVMDTSTVLVTVLDTISPVVVVNNPINLTLDETGNATVDINDIVVSATDNCTADEDLLIELGRSLDFTGADIPTTVAMLSVTDESGNVTEIEITFNINFLSPPVACITEVNVTLDADCGAEIIPSMVISGGAGNLDFLQLEVVVQDADGLNNLIDGCGRFIYTVTDLAAPGSTFDLEDFTGCWGYINAEDKTSPVAAELPTAPAELFCSELDDVNINTLASTVSRCFVVDNSGVPEQGVALFLQTPLGQKLAAGGGLPTFTDGCSNITICVNDMVAQGDACSDVVITRIFTARDGDCTSASGEANAPTVASYDITFTRPSIADVMDVPGLAEFSCEDFEATSANPQPEANDYPFLLRANGDTIFLGASFCNIGATFQDGPRITTCENTYKFIRTYTVIDWCEVSTIETFTQLVKVGDFTAPTLTAPTQDLNFDGVADNGPLFYSTNSQDCTGFFVIPSGAATDNCDATPTVSAVVFAFGDLTSTPIGPFNVGELAGGFPVGTHTLVYTASDDCDNTATLPVQFTIGDRTAPVAVCEDGLNISIGGGVGANGDSPLRAADVDRASRDECGAVTLAISRDGVNFFPTLTLDCDDISAVDANGDPIADLEITLQVTDGSGNVNQCWLNVVVEDKAAPICIAPTPRAFNCAELDGEFPDDLDASGLTDEEINDLLDNAFGVANGVDNCPTTTITQSYVDNRTDCGTGTITRTFTVTDAQGLTSPQGACRQTITIIGIHDYTIVFPADAENSECVEPDYNDVTFEERGCDLITVATDIDTFSATADECFKLRITYEVLNWCEYNTESDAYFIPRDADNDNNLNEATYLHVIPRDETTLGDDLAFLDRDNNRTNNTTIGNLDTGDGGILAGSDAAGYGQDGSRGAYVYQQFIKVYDDTAPTLDVDGSVTEFCDLDGDCIDDATLTFTVDDVCSPTAVNATVTLDAFINAGSDDIYTLADFVADGGNVTGSTTNANGTFTTTLADLPTGTHAIRVVATDGCGNTAVDLIVFTINDCKAPTPICINGLTATLMPDGNGGGMAAIWSSDFIASPSEDCSGEVKFAIYRSDDAAAANFAGPNPGDVSLELTCDDLGMLPIRIYAIDPLGNADYCETTLFVQAHNETVCTGPAVGVVAGLIATPNDELMSGVEVNITDNGSMNDLRITDAGLYSFAGLALGEDYTVQPVYDPSVNLANVSTGDLITISRHILGLAEMTNAYQLLAGDVTQDNNINVVDIIAIRRVILGLDNGFTATNSWRFYTEAGAEVFNANNLNGNITDANFAAIEMGNVNDLFGARASFGLNIMDQAIEAGNVYEVAVSSADMAGFQGTLELAAGLELVDVNFTGANTAFNLNAAANGLIAVSHVGAADAFTLEVRATVSGQLSELISVSDRMTVAEAYNAEGAAHGLNINFGTTAVTGTTFELGQNSPNPFAASTMITFELPTAATATLTVQDIQGRVIMSREIDAAAGTNTVTLESNELKGATGVLTYTLTAGDFTATRKMVVQ